MGNLPERGFGLVVRFALRKLFLLDRAALFGTYPDTVPLPRGYLTWADYFAGRRLDMTDFLPLGEPDPEGCKLSAVWTRVGEDVATIGMHFVHANPDVLGDTLGMTDDELDALEALFSTCWGSVKALFPSSLVLDRYEWHNFGVGIRRPNPKRRETSGLNVAGSLDPGEQLPPQVATSVTFKTSHRKTWGRVYLPAMGINQVDTGRIAAAVVASVRTAFGTLLDGAAAAHTPLVIWSPRRDGGALKFGKETVGGVVVDHHAASDDLPDLTSFAKSVDQVQVDDLFDVMESRRFDRATIKDTHTLGG